MGIDTLDHVNINTRNLDACVRFYAEVLGFENGPRPNFGFPGAWMYCGERAVIHVMANENAPVGPTGPLDHVAFRCRGFEEMRERLAANGLAFEQNVVPDFRIKQLFVRDPDGVKIELNFLDE
jgi:catechol 2,3-dioxygenase-like lactoylglutathione lyase family enzyme